MALGADRGSPPFSLQRSDFFPIGLVSHIRSDTPMPESQGLIISLGPRAAQWGPPETGAGLVSGADSKGLLSRIRPCVLVNPTFGSQGGEACGAWQTPRRPSPPKF